MATLDQTKKVETILRNLSNASPDILGSAVVNLEGFVIASLLTSQIENDALAGMSAAMLGVGGKMCKELMGADMRQTYARSDQGYIVLNEVGDDAMLIILANPRAKLGLLFLDIKRRVPEILKALK